MWYKTVWVVEKAGPASSLYLEAGYPAFIQNEGQVHLVNDGDLLKLASLERFVVVS
ncbi:MAG: hypothetical protein QGF12_08365 [SAR202 cluster bacterium]|jgi:hypothetical protein|nr:hypothetical protein [SAR202 cluster bacterium]